MRKKIVAGNWKMNLSFTEAEDLLYEIVDQLANKPVEDNVDIIIFPPALYLELASDAALDANIYYGAQNCSEYDNGAYTGEISAQMLNSMDATHVLVGHSERRKYFNESNQSLYNKIDQALSYNIVPVYCIGEQLEDRELNRHFDVIKEQLSEVVFKLSEEEFSNIIIAYEPVWAIGTGKTASPEQAQEMHEYIRNLIEKNYTKDIADKTYILYGGSCKPSNAKELFSCKDVDGGLIGGASLKYSDFIELIRIAETV
ncbi:MAG: triose-phosphate isomerase [Bacteroidales bacterium]|jgi:triosephosphate isomerase